MKKHFIILVICNLVLTFVNGQVTPEEISGLKNSLNHATTDTARIRIYNSLATGYRFSKIDSGIYYADIAIELSNRVNYSGGKIRALDTKGFILLEAGDIPQSLNCQLTALNILEDNPDTDLMASILNRIGNIYMELKEYKTAINYYRQSQNLFQQINDSGSFYNEVSNIGNVYELMGALDSSKIYQQKVFDFSIRNTNREAITYGEMRARFGNVESRLGNYDAALMHYRNGIRESNIDFDFRNLAFNYIQMAKLFNILHQYDSSFYYARKTIETGKSISFKKAIYEASGLMANLFQLNHQTDSALKYLELANAYKDSLYGAKTFQKLQLITLNEQQRQQQLQQEKEELQNRYRMITLISALFVFLLIAIILWFNNKKQKQANQKLNIQKEQISSQRNDLENMLSELKHTQQQLVQQEKLASLGALTAGIAHEIKNPLNFVNNFSELSTDLIDEFLSSSNDDERNEIANDLKQNLKKINQHGKRADSIVQAMLQHSRSGNAEKQMTDINKMCDEFLSLAYHGMRANVPDFNCELVKSLDESLPKINVVQQDINRVILNLLNNAFYAVKDKPDAKVELKTKSENGKIKISIRDNGSGIPESIKQKIFEPFFTTKPTGEGTGLGLSICNDIVKAHGGELKVVSKENEFTEFVILFPVS